MNDTLKDPAPWWQSATGYQIYPRSFCDSNGDGIGDIPGIVSKLDHLRELGIGFIWLSPVYRSPMADNGYDISDYRDIAPEFGTLEDFDLLVAEAKARDIGIVMDLVVNHSSSDHAWFHAARTSRTAPEHDYYVWRDAAPDGGPPSDHQAAFGGSAWTWVPEVLQYYLGHFSPHQPDLNWQNPALRREIYDMMIWWLDRGIAGFRMDVISLIGKDVDAGVYEEGPYLHGFLQEMHREVLAGRDIVTVGESWSVSTGTAPLYCGRGRDELNMVFQFNHVVEGWDPVHGKWKPKPFDLVAFKQVLNDWQAALADDGWNSLFLSNHDLPRQVSKYGDDGEYRVKSAKMLATVTHLMKGTPFVYQGEEIGMTNTAFTRIDQFRDLETLGHYAEEIARGVTPEDFIAGANANGRDNARTPMQWSARANAGFTTGTPWIEVNPNHSTINVEADRADPDGVLAHYKRLIALRKTWPVVVHGIYVPVAEENDAIFAYVRELDGVRLAVVANFTAEKARFDVPEHLAGAGRCLIANAMARDRLQGQITLEPFEAFAMVMSSG
ncbi:glycoside hydrolase family 13 protein [Sagittula stellata]|uniref:Oligosaccharide alpha-1,6-glucosidase protein n=1 Tax=Sagittula stellata (strain ATCC 700073 / DSM 11524 / E-37) TaxID=388399 RepID=A3K7L2_SAGS3|nr:alpha-glucosidase [Sagittula stellata]EBA06971.1 oligosaccharide alpha-1,6-glucosidase protein [Sagittula stellata E-37]